MLKTFLIIEDHLLFAQALSELISAIDNLTCCGILTKGENAVSEIVEKNPDIVLLDLNLPDINGIEIIKQIRKSGIQTPILVISMLIDPIIVGKALEAGANGFVPKNTSIEELSSALEHISNGQAFLPESLKAQIDLNNLTVSERYSITENTDISKRELEIIKLIASGLTNNEIAEQLFISPHTVKTHRTNILRKLELPNTAALVSYAKNLGLI